MSEPETYYAVCWSPGSQVSSSQKKMGPLVTYHPSPEAAISYYRAQSSAGVTSFIPPTQISAKDGSTALVVTPLTKAEFSDTPTAFDQLARHIARAAATQNPTAPYSHRFANARGEPLPAHRAIYTALLISTPTYVTVAPGPPDFTSPPVPPHRTPR